ncbi:hypothetical protein HaLaN_29203 [Haematococcus lacustris]|uniref:Uncharacterized protein n=1 Tax=Haematococcus lacustris TaxID=44745 RepID=A0A6A0ACR9_HAELA|nr:hypothetical protein HaLaN_29203 [Haematococcus lacustris]
MRRWMEIAGYPTLGCKRRRVILRRSPRYRQLMKRVQPDSMPCRPYINRCALSHEGPEAELPVYDENQAWEDWSMGTYTTDVETEEGVEEHNEHHTHQQQPMEEDEASNPEMIHATDP